MRKRFLCTECARKHKFSIPPNQKIYLPEYVLIDGEKWIMWYRSPSRKVKCSECGKKTSHVFEPYNQ